MSQTSVLEQIRLYSEALVEDLPDVSVSPALTEGSTPAVRPRVPMRYRWVWAIAGAVLVLLLVGVPFLLGRTGSPPVTEPEPTETTIPDPVRRDSAEPGEELEFKGWTYLVSAAEGGFVRRRDASEAWQPVEGVEIYAVMPAGRTAAVPSPARGVRLTTDGHTIITASPTHGSPGSVMFISANCQDVHLMVSVSTDGDEWKTTRLSQIHRRFRNFADSNCYMDQTGGEVVGPRGIIVARAFAANMGPPVDRYLHVWFSDTGDDWMLVQLPPAMQNPANSGTQAPNTWVDYRRITPKATEDGFEITIEYAFFKDNPDPLGEGAIEISGHSEVWQSADGLTWIRQPESSSAAPATTVSAPSEIATELPPRVTGISGGAYSSAGELLVDLRTPEAADDGVTQPLGARTELPSTVRLDFLFEFCETRHLVSPSDGCYRDAHFMDPADPSMGSGPYLQDKAFHVRHGFPNETGGPLSDGFTVRLYVAQIDGAPDEGGPVGDVVTRSYTPDYTIFEEVHRCGPRYQTQDRPVTCQQFVHEFHDGLPFGRHALWAVWEAPCSWWVDNGFLTQCDNPDTIVSEFFSGFDSAFVNEPVEYSEPDEGPSAQQP